MTELDSWGLFSKRWSAYEKVLKHNHMFHNEIYSDIKGYINKRKLNEPITILEPGCGDASQTIKLFKNIDVARYCGIDLSAFALNIAKHNLISLSSNIKLECVDMLVGMSSIDTMFDVVFTSYAIHHLSTEGKRQFFSLAADKLKDDGMLIYIDVMKENDEQDRKSYIKSYLGHVNQYWSGLEQDEVKFINEHISNYDFPECAEVNIQLAENSGFKNFIKLSRHTWHQAIIFTKQA